LKNLLFQNFWKQGLRTFKKDDSKIRRIVFFWLIFETLKDAFQSAIYQDWKWIFIKFSDLTKVTLFHEIRDAWNFSFKDRTDPLSAELSPNFHVITQELLSGCLRLRSLKIGYWYLLQQDKSLKLNNSSVNELQENCFNVLKLERLFLMTMSKLMHFL
jgi:hypothetical protein